MDKEVTREDIRREVGKIMDLTKRIGLAGRIKPRGPLAKRMSAKGRQRK